MFLARGRKSRLHKYTDINFAHNPNLCAVHSYADASPLVPKPGLSHRSPDSSPPLGDSVTNAPRSISR